MWLWSFHHTERISQYLRCFLLNNVPRVNESVHYWERRVHGNSTSSLFFPLSNPYSDVFMEWALWYSSLRYLHSISECWIKSWLVCLWSSFWLMHSGKQQVMVPLIDSCHPFVRLLASPWFSPFVDVWGELADGKPISLSMEKSVSLSPSFLCFFSLPLLSPTLLCLPWRVCVCVCLCVFMRRCLQTHYVLSLPLDLFLLFIQSDEISISI